MENLEALEITLQVAKIFDDLGVPYVVGGSMASIIHGMIRTTMDVDLVVDLGQEHVGDLLSKLNQDFYADESMIRNAIQQNSSFNLIHLNSIFKVDVFIPKNRLFDRQQLDRRIAQSFDSKGDSKLWVLTAEDIILAKLDWFRMGGEISERQWRDILGVVKTQGSNLDTQYLEESASLLGVADLLETALKEINS